MQCFQLSDPVKGRQTQNKSSSKKVKWFVKYLEMLQVKESLTVHTVCKYLKECDGDLMVDFVPFCSETEMSQATAL